MARLSYGAPGVYVEEVPSARQPIAGVGTNTVAFIGLVPDVIYRPVPYGHYDPVAARELGVIRRAPANEEEEARQAEARKQLKEQLDRLNDRQRALQQSLDDQKKRAADAKAEREGLPADAEASAVKGAERKLRAADEAAKAAQADLDQNNADIKRMQDALAAPPAAAPVAKDELEAEDLEYQDGKPADDLLQPSNLRPYYFERFELAVDPLATKLCTNFTEYTKRFGDFSGFSDQPDNPAAAPERRRYRPLHPGHHYLTHAVKGFFDNGGTRAFVARITNLAQLKDVLERLESIDEVSIIAAPGLPKTREVWEQLQTYAEDPDHQNVFAVLDCPAVVNDGKSADFDIERLGFDNPQSALPRMSNHAAYYFPHIEVSDPAKRIQDDDPAREVPPKYRGLTYAAPSGHMAGVYARIDEERGVHKAPANAVVRGALNVKYYVSKPKQDLLNPQGVNCIRQMNGTVMVWGARNIGGDRLGEWKYVNVRRFAGFLEESIDEGTQWVVFEPNDPSLWSKIRLNVGAFLTNVWRNGALFGQTPEEAFYVKCDAELNPPEVRDLGQVITEIGVAIVRPAEFVIFRIAQFAGSQKA